MFIYVFTIACSFALEVSTVIHFYKYTGISVSILPLMDICFIYSYVLIVIENSNDKNILEHESWCMFTIIFLEDIHRNKILGS